MGERPIFRWEEIQPDPTGGEPAVKWGRGKKQLSEGQFFFAGGTQSAPFMREGGEVSDCAPKRRVLKDKSNLWARKGVGIAVWGGRAGG